MSGQGDPREAFERLFRAHYWAVRGYVLRRYSSAFVEDVLAETFLVAWRRLEAVPDDALPWLLGVARRVLANQHRADQRRGALTRRLAHQRFGSGGVWEPPGGVSEELARALASLSEREREALLLVAWEELSPERAAVAAGCTPAAFRVRLHRARHRVAALLAANPVDPAHPQLTEEIA